jgi:DNA-binding protein
MSNEARDTIFIGKKPLMAYVTSTLIQLANLPAVSIKARGLSIGRAVDVAQIVARKTENAGYTIGDITIGSESLKSQDGRTRNVSTIEIELKQNLEKHEKKNDDESYAQDSNDLIEKKLKEEYKDDVKILFEISGFEILFEDENCIFAKNIDTSYTIFCVKAIEKNVSEFFISEDELTSFLERLNKPIKQSRKKKEKTSKHSTDNSFFDNLRVGSLTDFGWDSHMSDFSRKESLIKKICADGIVSTLHTLNLISNNPGYYEDTIDSIKKDIAYVESLSLQNEINTNDTLYKFRKNMYTLKPELEKNYEVPSKMFFIKLTRKKSDIY